MPSAYTLAELERIRRIPDPPSALVPRGQVLSGLDSVQRERLRVRITAKHAPSPPPKPDAPRQPTKHEQRRAAQTSDYNRKGSVHPEARKVTDEQVIAAFRDVGTLKGAARRLGVDHATMRRRLKALGVPTPGVVFQDRPPALHAAPPAHDSTPDPVLAGADDAARVLGAP